MTNNQIARLAELLGWEYGNHPLYGLTLISSDNLKRYLSPKTNADLMLRLMVDHDMGVDKVQNHWESTWDILQFDTPQAAIIAAVIAKLEAQDDG